MVRIYTIEIIEISMKIARMLDRADAGTRSDKELGEYIHEWLDDNIDDMETLSDFLYQDYKEHSSSPYGSIVKGLLMEINITELALSRAKDILKAFKHAELGSSDVELKIANVIIPGVLIIQATDVQVPNMNIPGRVDLRPGVKIATHDDVYELADIDYGSIKIL